MDSTPLESLRRGAVSAAAVVVLLLLVVPGANANEVSFAAKRVEGDTAVFRVVGIGPREVRRAKIRVGGYRKRIRASTMRRAARRGRLRVRLPRRVAKRLPQGRVRLKRRWPRLTVLTGSVSGPLVGFEKGNFSEVQSLDQKFGHLWVTASSAYEGAHSAHADYLGGGPGTQRVWLPTDWNTGSDVWYGVALYIPTSTEYCYWNPLRWDNYALYGGVDDDKPGQGDVGGLAIEQNRIRVIQDYYGQTERKLIDGGAVPKGRWFWVELHQRFSGRDGEALSELYLDGRRLGSSTKANSAGRPIKHLRAGAVNVADECSSPGAVGFDRLSISNSQRGPA